MKKLVWRLSKLPSVEELLELVKDKIITQDETREILFSSEIEEDREKKSLESEIKFLRELVEKLSNRSQIVEIIKEIPIYRKYSWYKPYEIWCGSGIIGGSYCLNATNANTINNSTTAYTQDSGFSSIKTF